jgi:hypothetical protein
VVLGSSFVARQALYVRLLTLMEDTYLLVSTKSNNAVDWTDLKYIRLQIAFA